MSYICRETVPREALLEAKGAGFSDMQIGRKIGLQETDARKLRLAHDISPWVKQVSKTMDTCFHSLKKKTHTLNAGLGYYGKLHPEQVLHRFFSWKMRPQSIFFWW